MPTFNSPFNGTYNSPQSELPRVSYVYESGGTAISCGGQVDTEVVEQPFLVNLHYFLLNDSFVAQYCGTKIFPMAIPQKEKLPCMTYHVISSQHFADLGGTSALCTVRIQFDSWSRKFADAVGMAEGLRLALQGFRGVMGTSYVAGVVLDNEVSFYEQAQNASDRGLYHFASDFLISYVEQRTNQRQGGGDLGLNTFGGVYGRREFAGRF